MPSRPLVKAFDESLLGDPDADTITLHADSAFAAAPSPGDVYAIYNPFPSNCYDAGEVVILNFMADAMLAQDLTKPGGTIYFPTSTELAGASHFAPNSSNTTIARYALSWLEEFVDNDDRYEQFLCGAGTESTVDDYRTTCPLTN